MPDRLAAGVLMLGLSIFLFLAWLPLEISLSRFGFEDLFYYLQVARNLASGAGPTLDGIHPTNGFHPLWMLISIALVSPFGPGSKVPVHFAFTLCAVFHVLTALLVYRIVRQRGNAWVAVAAMSLWLFNFAVAGIAMCGLETALFGLLLMATVYFYLDRRENLSGRGSLVLGALLGLTTLARFDGALLGFALGADQFVLWLRKRESVPRLVGRSVPMSAVAVALLIPWLVWSSRVSGSLLPNSHRAIKLWLGTEATGGAYLYHLASQLVHYAPEAARMYGLMPLWPFSLIAVLALGALLFRKASERGPGLPLFVFVAYPSAQALYYAGNFAPLNRYLYPAHLVVFTGIMVILANRLEGKRAWQTWVAAAGAFLVFAVNAGVCSARSWQEGRGSAGTHSLHWTMYMQAVPWIREHIPTGEKIGAFNCGIFSYFSGRTVVNLDGVINDSVIPALEEHRLFSYLQDEGIAYLIDWEATLNFALARYGGAKGDTEECRLVHSFQQPWGPYKGARLMVIRLAEPQKEREEKKEKEKEKELQSWSPPAQVDGPSKDSLPSAVP